jgi:hypothetical protein
MTRPVGCTCTNSYTNADCPLHGTHGIEHVPFIAVQVGFTDHCQHEWKQAAFDNPERVCIHCGIDHPDDVWQQP